MFSKAQLTPCMALRESRHSGRHVKPHQNPVFEILQVYTSHFPFVQVSAEPLAAGSSFKHRAQYLSSTSFSWSTVYVCLFLSRGTDLAPFRSLKWSACSIWTSFPLRVNSKIENMSFLHFSPLLLFCQDRQEFPSQPLREFPLSLVSSRETDVSGFVSILQKRTSQIYSPKSNISYFVASSCFILL